MPVFRRIVKAYQQPMPGIWQETYPDMSYANPYHQVGRRGHVLDCRVSGFWVGLLEEIVQQFFGQFLAAQFERAGL
jgi:hypothetical protein